MAGGLKKAKRPPGSGSGTKTASATRRPPSKRPARSGSVKRAGSIRGAHAGRAKKARSSESRAKAGNGGRPSRKPDTRVRASLPKARAAASSPKLTKAGRKRPPAGKGKAKDGLARVRGEFSPATDWQDLMAMADLDGVRVYSMKMSYSRGEVIQHKVFGIGIVVQEIGGAKIQVSFQDGTRLLVCNWHK